MSKYRHLDQNPFDAYR